MLGIDLDNFEMAQNKEEWACDHDEDRLYWEVAQCPHHKSCTANAYKRACIWSLEGPEQCLSYLYWHLVKSVKHEKTAEHALEILAGVTPEEKTDSGHERKQERAAHERARVKQEQVQEEERKRKSSSWDDKGSWQVAKRQRGPPQPASAPDAATVSLQASSPGDLVRLNQMTGNAVAKGLEIMSEAVSLTPVRRQELEEQTVKFKLSHVRIIHDALTRASMATTNLQHVLNQFLGQYKNEERVLNEARDLLAQYLAGSTVEAVEKQDRDWQAGGWKKKR